MHTKSVRWNCGGPPVWSLQLRPTHPEVVKRSISKWGEEGASLTVVLRCFTSALPSFCPPIAPNMLHECRREKKLRIPPRSSRASFSGCERNPSQRNPGAASALPVPPSYPPHPPGCLLDNLLHDVSWSACEIFFLGVGAYFCKQQFPN